MMLKPYINVARMHVLIIIFGFLQAFERQGVMLYLLLIFYFFPVSTLLKSLKKNGRRKK